jgi:transcription initiation factor IIF auxiliary subunit
MNLDLEIQNSWEYQDDDWWEWSAYITGRSMDKVKWVEYILHPSFRNPVRRETTRADGFKMETEGWGTFKLKAVAHMIDGRDVLLTHNVVLKKSPRNGKTDG